MRGISLAPWGSQLWRTRRWRAIDAAGVVRAASFRSRSSWSLWRWRPLRFSAQHSHPVEGRSQRPQASGLDVRSCPAIRAWSHLEQRSSGPAPAATSLPLVVTLQPRDPAALAAEVQAVSDPGSPEYRHFLTPAQFAQRFGPTPATVAQVKSTLRQEGLTVGTPSSTGLSLPVLGHRVAEIESAFSTPIERYHLASGKTGYDNKSAPQVPVYEVAPQIVKESSGLDTAQPAQAVDDRPQGEPCWSAFPVLLRYACTSPGPTNAPARFVYDQHRHCSEWRRPQCCRIGAGVLAGSALLREPEPLRVGHHGGACRVGSSRIHRRQRGRHHEFRELLRVHTRRRTAHEYAG